MRSSDVAWKAAALISAACLSGACARSQLWALAAIPLPLVVLWLVAKNPGLGFRPALFLSASAAFAALGLHLQLSVPLMLMGAAGALAAWDLSHFADRLKHAVNGEHRVLLQRSHLQSLVAAIASGLLLAFLASVVRLQLSFGIVSLLALVLVLALAEIPRVMKGGGGRS